MNSESPLTTMWIEFLLQQQSSLPIRAATETFFTEGDDQGRDVGGAGNLGVSSYMFSYTHTLKIFSSSFRRCFTRN